MAEQITRKMLTSAIRVLRKRSQPITLPALGGDFWIFQCTPDQAVDVVEIMRTGRPLPLLIKVVRQAGLFEEVES